MDTPSSAPRRGLRSVAAVLALCVAAAAGYGVALWRLRSASDPAAHATAPAARTAAERRVLYWYDPMVPQQHFDQPGKSPFMDMMLVPKYADEEPGAAPAVAVDPRVAQSLGMRVAEVRREPLGGGLSVPAIVGFDERRVVVLQARSAGFVERVPPHAPGDVVAQGALLAEVLLPEWAGAQQEYLAVRATGDTALAAAARQRLRLLGMPDTLVAEVERSGRPNALVAGERHLG